MSKSRRSASEVRGKKLAKPSSPSKGARAKEPAVRSPAKPEAKPATKPTTKPATKPTTMPATKPATMPATKPAEPTVPKTVIPPQVAAILAIGDEVLRGEILNSNAAFLADRLFDAGYEVKAHRVASDTPADIQAALESLALEASVIVATGGLGPTEDDRTVDVVAKLLGVETAPHGPSMEAMKRRFSAHGFELTPNNLRQVRVPEGAHAFLNSAGIAPGFAVHIGAAEAYFLPGIPREMESIFLGHCLPRLIERASKHGVVKAAVRTFHLYGMGESHIDHRLVGLIQDMPGVSLHFRTASPENHVKVVVRTNDLAKSQATLAQVEHELRKRIGQGIYGVDDETFPMIVGKTLREAGATLALAESCTAGYAGQLITSEPGASDFYLGGVMAYANEGKTNVLGVPVEVIAEHGAVSEPCARAMAEGARKLFNSSLAVSITGIAGAKMDGRPGTTSGQVQGEKPVGTVCFSVAGPRPTKSATKLFAGDRERIRRAAAYFALDMARRYFM